MKKYSRISSHQLSASTLARRHYRAITFGVRIYNFLRLQIFPIDWLRTFFHGKEGTILCLGCGYGILETIIAADNPQLHVIASDLVPERIAAAKRMVSELRNIEFAVVDVTQLAPGKQYDHIMFFDLLHHLAAGEQEKLLDKIWAAVRPGGTIIMKDVDTAPRWKYYWNMLHDRFMAGLPLTYYPSAFYHDYFRKKGATVTRYTPDAFRSPYNHYALIVEKPKP